MWLLNVCCVCRAQVEEGLDSRAPHGLRKEAQGEGAETEACRQETIGILQEHFCNGANTRSCHASSCLFAFSVTCRKSADGVVSGGKDLAQTAYYPAGFVAAVFKVWFTSWVKHTVVAPMHCSTSAMAAWPIAPAPVLRLSLSILEVRGVYLI